MGKEGPAQNVLLTMPTAFANGGRRRGGGVNQSYSRLSTTHGCITDCKLDSVLYAGVCVVM